MASAFGMSYSGVRKNLYVLRDLGHIERIGSNKTGRWKVIDDK